MSDTQITALNQLKLGNFVKFVGRDKSGKYSYTGEVITIQKETGSNPPMFELLTFDGIMGFTFPQINATNKEIENELYLTDVKPKGWSKFKKDPSKFFEHKEENEKVIPVKPLRQRVIELVAANPRKKELALLKLAKKEIGGSDAKLTNYIKLALTKK